MENSWNEVLHPEVIYISTLNADIRHPATPEQFGSDLVFGRHYVPGTGDPGWVVLLGPVGRFESA